MCTVLLPAGVNPIAVKKIHQTHRLKWADDIKMYRNPVTF